ncbi:MAG: hypothetical protein IJH64_01595 [Oscillospiraceae bacterium]|nr:hypothetical protein [Oscillospiraceae bacterium]
MTYGDLFRSCSNEIIAEILIGYAIELMVCDHPANTAEIDKARTELLETLNSEVEE